ncbi:MAG TPA: DUF3631 domain-containing protein [Candidatus Angelobacter sp.]
MHPFDDNYLSKMSPDFEKKPKPEPAPPPPQSTALVRSALQSPAPKHPAPELFDSVAAYISQYLACDQNQLTVLTLWSAYTWSYKHFPAAVYLNVRSPGPQSGKTLCLSLLCHLSANTSFAAGISPGELKRRLLIPKNRIGPGEFNSTVFLDDCHHTFSASERQASLALLNSGADADSCYPSSGEEYSVFGPKAFAGNAPLPQSLASRCIPITLNRKKPSDVVSRFHRESARDAAIKLVDKLTSWTSANRKSLEAAAAKAPPPLPPGLTPREQASAEPLLHIADLIGGAWPEKVRTALINIFRLAEGVDGIELLCDIRAIFYVKKNPQYLSTKDLLSTLRGLEHRPWSGWGLGSGKKLGQLLHPFRIHSRSLHIESQTTFRGYLFEHFKDAWERYTPPLNVDSGTKNPSATGSAT